MRFLVVLALAVTAVLGAPAALLPRQPIGDDVLGSLIGGGLGAVGESRVFPRLRLYAIGPDSNIRKPGNRTVAHNTLQSGSRAKITWPILLRPITSPERYRATRRQFTAL
ncbi:hypothetical protein EXIGLDRAFT_708828 [Exidia glandulosa HHB12029]|uniref:Uncharacterized protein n=1 Tax=Exidia glandulosa HHB12029 TaxID=1314781 RepID=A0A165J6U2_EXIGL|nr:hypothetical protein EXIGLDRAFT_708828 [Exidia glandulosa HHB12029]